MSSKGKYRERKRRLHLAIESRSIDDVKSIDSVFFSHFKPIGDGKRLYYIFLPLRLLSGTVGFVDPKALTVTQLQLCTYSHLWRTQNLTVQLDIEGVTEEITYETKLTDEFHRESSVRIDACKSLGLHILTLVCSSLSHRPDWHSACG